MGELRDRARAAVGGLEPDRRGALHAERARAPRGQPAYDENVCCASSPATVTLLPGEVPPEHEQLEQRHVLRLVHHEVRDALPGAAAAGAPRGTAGSAGPPGRGCPRSPPACPRRAAVPSSVSRRSGSTPARSSSGRRRELQPRVPERLVDGGGGEVPRRGADDALEERRGRRTGRRARAAAAASPGRASARCGRRRSVSYSAGWRLRRETSGGRVGAEPRRRRAERALERAARPRVERPDRRLVEAERLEEPRREPREARSRDDDLQARGREAARILEGDAREPVQRDGGLAAAGAADDEQRARRAARTPPRTARRRAAP